MTAFFSSHVDQRLVDLNLRPHHLVGNDATTYSGKISVPSSELSGAVHIIFIGQSTNSNSLPDGFVPTHANAIFNMSIAHRGTCFLANDPLLSSDIIGGHHGMYLADGLIADGLVEKVILTNIICGGNYFADWVPGGGIAATNSSRPGDLAYRIGLTARCIANAGLEDLPTIIDIQGGEWDTSNGTSQANATAALNGIVTEAKRVGLLKGGNFAISHLNTRIYEAAHKRANIRASQEAIVDGEWVRMGADIDTLGNSYRVDGTHFSTLGGMAQAELKGKIYANLLSSQR